MAHVAAFAKPSNSVFTSPTTDDGEERFFLAFAKRWRKLQTETALRQQLKNDTHSPGEYRSDTVRNIDGWYNVYKAAPGDKLYLKPDDRARIW